MSLSERAICVAGGILAAMLLLRHSLDKSKGPSTEVIPVIVPGMPRLPEFCHATIHARLLHISGCIGLDGDNMRIVSGGIKNEIKAALLCVKRIMEYSETNYNTDKCKLIKVNVYLKDNSKERFLELNEGYAEFFKESQWAYPARITVGCGALALGAQIEIDAIASA